MKNKILKSITMLAFIGLMFSGLSLDTIPDISLVVGGICGVWILLFCAANEGVVYV